MFIKSNTELFQLIKKYEDLTKSTIDKKTEAERREHNREISRLGGLIRNYRFKHAVELAVFQNNTLIGTFTSTSDIEAVRHFENIQRQNHQPTLDFSVYRTFSYNQDYDYIIGVSPHPIDTNKDKGKLIDDFTLFKSTLEYFRIEDRYEIDYPSMPV